MTDSFFDLTTHSDEDVAESIEALNSILEVTKDARSIVDNPESYTKEEALRMLNYTTQIMETVFQGTQMIFGSLQLHKSNDGVEVDGPNG